MWILSMLEVQTISHGSFGMVKGAPLPEMQGEAPALDLFHAKYTMNTVLEKL